MLKDVFSGGRTSVCILPVGGWAYFATNRHWKHIARIVFLGFFWPVVAEAQSVVFDAASSAQEEFVSTNPALTWSHTVGTGASRLLIVSVSISYSGTTVSGITYGGVSLTSVGSVNAPSSDGRIEIWRLINPTSGTANIALSLASGSSSTVVGGGVSFSNVNQTTPLGTFASASAFNSATPSVTVTSATGDLVTDVVMWNTTTVLTVGGAQTQRWNRTTSGIVGAGSTAPGAASVTMSWTHAAATDSWAIGAVSIHQAPLTFFFRRRGEDSYP
jgi:hypothetical protein